MVVKLELCSNFVAVVGCCQIFFFHFFVLGAEWEVLVKLLCEPVKFICKRSDKVSIIGLDYCQLLLFCFELQLVLLNVFLHFGGPGVKLCRHGGRVGVERCISVVVAVN